LEEARETFSPFLNNYNEEENVREKEFLIDLEKIKNQPASSYSHDQARKLLKNYSIYI